MINDIVILIIGAATAFNGLIILYKVRRELWINAAIDAGLLFGIFYVFQGSFKALAAGTVASAIISIFLIFIPITFENWNEPAKRAKEKTKAKNEALEAFRKRHNIKVN